MPTFSLASFNTHYGVRAGLRPATPYDMTTALHRLAADVLVIQEVWRPDGERGSVDDAAAELGLPVHYEQIGRATMQARWPHPHADGEGTFGIAVLTRFPVRVAEGIVVGPTRLDTVPLRRVFPVDVVVGDGVEVRLIAVHLTSRLPHGPPDQLRRLVRAVPPPGTPTVVAGDCNFWGPGVRAYFRGWQRAVRGRTWPARRPHSQIDHVLVRPGDVQVLRGEVLPDLGSDHRPVRVELRV
jgi:endonuclease/exonuclease/phosphatase family metal-dependent hydrolase